ncbi:MAG: AIR synthase related protein, partial [Actinomycetota bacterium]|nr:AIR synthase related protein [Actinomycetota bacterium]
EVMWQLSETVDGLADACRAFDLPVIGGNVSLYNETTGADISPTPVLGVLGLVERLRHRPPPPATSAGSTVVLLGARRAAGALGSVPGHPLAGSRWAVECRGRRHGTLPSLDLEAHARLARLVASLVAEAVGETVGGTVAGAVGETVGGGHGLLDGVHDVSGGGLAVALAEMAVAGGVGVEVRGIEGHAELFTELPSRVLVTTGRPDELLARAHAAGVPAEVLGTAGGDRLVVSGPASTLVDLSMAELSEAMAGSLAKRLEAA